MPTDWDNNLPLYVTYTASTDNRVVITVPMAVTHPDYRPPARPLKDIKLRDERAKWRR